MPKKSETRPAGGARAPFPPRQKSKHVDPRPEAERLQTHEALMKCSPAYRKSHTITKAFNIDDVAEVLAAGVVSQCHELGRAFWEPDFPYSGAEILERVVDKLKKRLE